jgi:hypothetical protein
MGRDLTVLRHSEGIRWAVGDANARRSSTYRFWGNKKGDFYLSVRSLGGFLKTSLHRDGRCHTGLTSEYAAQRGVAVRHLDRWTVPLDQMVKAVQVMVPEHDLAVFGSDDKDPMRWLRAPRAGRVAMIGIVTLPAVQVQNLGDSWPGVNEGTEPIGVIATSTRTAFVIHWENALAADQETELQNLRALLAADAARQGIVPGVGLRAVLVGQVSDAKTTTRSLIDISFQDAA